MSEVYYEKREVTRNSLCTSSSISEFHRGEDVAYEELEIISTAEEATYELITAEGMNGATSYSNSHFQKPKYPKSGQNLISESDCVTEESVKQSETYSNIKRKNKPSLSSSGKKEQNTMGNTLTKVTSICRAGKYQSTSKIRNNVTQTCKTKLSSSSKVRESVNYLTSQLSGASQKLQQDEVKRIKSPTVMSDKERENYLEKKLDVGDDIIIPPDVKNNDQKMKYQTIDHQMGNRFLSKDTESTRKDTETGESYAVADCDFKENFINEITLKDSSQSAQEQQAIGLNQSRISTFYSESLENSGLIHDGTLPSKVQASIEYQQNASNDVDDSSRSSNALNSTFLNEENPFIVYNTNESISQVCDVNNINSVPKSNNICGMRSEFQSNRCTAEKEEKDQSTKQNLCSGDCEAFRSTKEAKKIDELSATPKRPKHKAEPLFLKYCTYKSPQSQKRESLRRMKFTGSGDTFRGNTHDSGSSTEGSYGVYNSSRSSKIPRLLRYSSKLKMLTPPVSPHLYSSANHKQDRPKTVSRDSKSSSVPVIRKDRSWIPKRRWEETSGSNSESSFIIHENQWGNVVAADAKSQKINYDVRVKKVAPKVLFERQVDKSSKSNNNALNDMKITDGSIRIKIFDKDVGHRSPWTVFGDLNGFVDSFMAGVKKHSGEITSVENFSQEDNFTDSFKDTGDKYETHTEIETFLNTYNEETEKSIMRSSIMFNNVLNEAEGYETCEEELPKAKKPIKKLTSDAAIRGKRSERKAITQIIAPFKDNVFIYIAVLILLISGSFYWIRNTDYLKAFKLMKFISIYNIALH